MNSEIMNILNILDEAKLKLTDNEYKGIMDSLKLLHENKKDEKMKLDYSNILHPVYIGRV